MFSSYAAYDFSDTIGRMITSRGSWAIGHASLGLGRGRGRLTGRRRGISDGREPRDRSLECRAGEDEPVVHQHVVDVELLGEHDLHTLTQIAEALPRLVFGAVQHEQHPRCALVLRAQTQRAHLGCCSCWTAPKTRRGRASAIWVSVCRSCSPRSSTSTTCW